MRVDVRTSKGRIQGAEEGRLCVFRGIPFARPPIGELRFRAPQEALPWDDVRDATQFGNRAWQVTNEALEAILGKVEGLPPMDEDCLTLNIWTPGLDAKGFPVMVWIHGGGFAIGAGSEPLYDGTALASRDVVVVTINYRLGALGFLCVPGFADNQDESYANWGILDQIAALKWVQAEIAAFGGDPANVTVFGESAGAMSIGTLLGSPLAAGLFRKAILQSGAAHQGLKEEVAEKTTREFVQALGMSEPDAAALRSRSADELHDAQAKLEADSGWMSRRAVGEVLRYQPVIDGLIVPVLPIENVRRGLSNDVSILVGTTRDEYKLFATMAPRLRDMDVERAAKRVSYLLPGNDVARARSILDAYRLARQARGETTQPYELFCAIATDWIFRVPADRLTEAQSRLNENVFAYRLDWASPVGEGMLGACHAIDLPFVFGTQHLAKRWVGRGDDADALAKTIGDAWVAFARNGDPSTSALPWPRWDAAGRKTMILEREHHVEERPREPERRCWDEIIP